MSTRIVHLLVVLAALGAAMGASLGRAQAPGPAPDPINGMLGFSDGEQIYRQICQGCHMADGNGATGAGSYPAFTDNPKLISADYLAATILNGRANMPAFQPPADWSFFYPPTWLTDTQIANVVNYVRSHFGNAFEDVITSERVAALHSGKPAGEAVAVPESD